MRKSNGEKTLLFVFLEPFPSGGRYVRIQPQASGYGREGEFLLHQRGVGSSEEAIPIALTMSLSLIPPITLLQPGGAEEREAALTTNLSQMPLILLSRPGGAKEGVDVFCRP